MGVGAWPYTMVFTNIVWCMAYKEGVGGGRILRNGRASRSGRRSGPVQATAERGNHRCYG